MSARGTRRPHSRTPRPRKVKSGGSKKSGACLILAFAASLMPALLMAYVADVIWG